MTPRRKDESKRVLKEGEYQRDNGTYEFKWRDAKNIVKACNKRVMIEWEEESKTKDEVLITLPELSCHWLRHTFATRCCEARLDPKAIQSILGHADYETTMDIYVEVTEKYKSQEITCLGDYFDKLQLGNQSATKVKSSS